MKKVIVAVCLFSLVFTPTTYALGGKFDEGFYSSNDILFYNPEAAECTTGTIAAGGPSGGVDTLVKTATLETIFKALITGGMTSVQAAAVMGSMYAESGFNSDAHEVGNDIGYGLVQWSFGRRTNLENFAKEKGLPVSDVNLQIEFLFKEYNASYKNSLVGTSFEKSLDVGEATKSWMVKFEVPAMKPLNDPAALNSKRIPAALKIHGFYKDLSPGVGAVGTSNCGSDNGAVSGSIVDTALSFALETPATDGMTAKSDAKPSYQTAKDSLNPDGAWSDCGRFVATVMIASGVDTDYVKGGTSAQIAYVRSKPAKYKIIEKPSSVNDLQPGDILITAGHTLIYTGKTPYPAVDASLNDHVPSVKSTGGLTWMLNTNPIAVRVIQ